MKRFVKQSGIKIALTIVGLSGFLVLGAVGAAMAQDYLKNYAPVLPDATFMPVEEFNAKTVEYQDKPAGDDALAYKFRLPVGWKKPDDVILGNFQISNKILVEIARYYGPPVVDSRSYFSLQATNLEYQLTAQQWLLQFLLSNGFTIQGIREYDDRRAEALYVKVDNNIPYVIRVVAQLNGNRMVMAQYFMPTDNWEDERQIQAQVMDSFRLQNFIDEPVEKLTKHPFLDLAEFYYPESWEFRSTLVRSSDRMGFELLNVESEETISSNSQKTLHGKVQVEIVSYDISESAESEIEIIKEKLAKTGLVVGAEIETRKDFQFSEGVEPAEAKVYKVVDSKSSSLKYEFWIMVIDVDGYYYIVTLTTPAREDEFFVWARNTQAYELIIEKFRPLEESLLGR